MADSGMTRRGFIKAAAAAGALAGGVRILGAGAKGGAKQFKVGLIGCGGRGGGAIGQHVQAYEYLNKALNLGIEVKPFAFADWFKDRAENLGKRYNVPAENCFGGADAYRKLLDTGVDIVLIATPPAFRPLHVETCVKEGRHVFMEKPVAVDPVGVRRVIAAGEEARKKGLTIVAGTQRRHEKSRIDHVAALREGLYGRIMGGRVAWCQGKIFSNTPINPKGPNDLAGGGKWQLWIEMSGDHIVEQHVHNIDVANWYLGAPPVAAVGFGGRARRVAGNMYDFFSVDFEYPDHIHVHSTCRQMGGCYNWQGEHFTYEKKPDRTEKVKSPVPEEIPQEGGSQHQEHTNMMYYLLKGKPLNEAENVALATAAAIMGRDSAYTGKRITLAEMISDPKKNPEYYNRQLKPTAEDFERGELVMPKDGDAPIPGEA